MIRRKELLVNKWGIVWFRYYFPFLGVSIPKASMTFVFEGQPLKNKAFSNQNKGPHLGSKYTLYTITSSWEISLSCRLRLDQIRRK